MTRRARVGSCIQFPVGDGKFSYIHFIGPGIHGDAVRVLPGIYAEPLPVDVVADLVSGGEDFIAQTFVLSVLDLPEAEIVLTRQTRNSSELAPWWVSSPIPPQWKDRWVISFDRNKQYRMADFSAAYPEINTTNLPETATNGEGVLQDMIRMGWKPAYGDFGVWSSVQKREHPRS
jgi:hypothetical protein